MIDITNKQRGNCGLGIAIRYFLEEVTNKSTLNLCDKYEKYKLN